MPQPKNHKKEMAQAIIHRITNSGMSGKIAEKCARHMFLGASNMALQLDNPDVAHVMHTCFTDVVENGIKKIYTWAETTMPSPRKPVTSDKKAA